MFSTNPTARSGGPISGPIPSGTLHQPTSSMANTSARAAATSAAAAAASAAAAAASTAAANAPPPVVQEFTIRVQKNIKKQHHVMRFNATLNVDFAQWKMVKLERENNLKEFRGFDEDMPKFGAGSEYNRELREEVRRKKYGIVAKRYKPEAQPWILKVGGKSGKKFRGIREGGVGENAAFYVFAHAPDGAIEAYPLNEWYNFQPIQRYKALSAEEAEHEFGRRKKVLNYFSLMMRKRMKGDEDEPVDAEEAKAAKGAAKKPKDLKISDMDEWIDSDDDSSSEDEDKDKEKPKKDEADDSDDGGKKGKGKKGKKGKAPEKKKKKRDLDDEAFEESDDGDEEGRELDYISDSSDSEPDPESKQSKEMTSVAEEDALRKLLTSDDDSDEEKKSGDSDKEDAEAKSRKEKQEAKEAKEARDKHKKKKLKKKAREDATAKKESSSDLSSNSSDSDDSSNGNAAAKGGLPTFGNSSKSNSKKKGGNVAGKSRTPSPATATGGASNSGAGDSAAAGAVGGNNKRKMGSMPTDLGISDSNSNSPTATPLKRQRPDGSVVTPFASSSLPSMGGGGGSSRHDENGITEEAVRRYLMRKPMTTTELLTKFKNKKTGVSSEKLVETMTQILKKINPVKQTIQGKMYLSIKPK